MGYMDVQTDSAAWLKLIDAYPRVSSECRDADADLVTLTRVCNASDMCWAYKGAADVGFGSIKMPCSMVLRAGPQEGNFYDLSNYTSCLAWIGSTDGLNGMGALTPEQTDTICQPQANCTMVPGRLVKHNTSSTGTLDQSLYEQVVVSDHNSTATRSVCKNTYKNVLRLKVNNVTVLLETQCTAGRLCKLTGNYNLLDDEPGQPARPVPANDIDPEWKKVRAAAAVIDPFVCYGPKKQPITSWAIATAGILSGWLSTLFFLAQLLYSPGLTSFMGIVCPPGSPAFAAANSDDEKVTTSATANTRV